MMIMTAWYTDLTGNGSTALFRESRAMMTVVVGVIEWGEWTAVGEIAGSANCPS